MVTAVHGRSNEFRHGGIHDAEVAFKEPGFQVFHAREEHACLSDDGSAGFYENFNVRIFYERADLCDNGRDKLRWFQRFFVGFVSYAGAAPNVEMLQSDAAIKQLVHENRKHFDLRHVGRSGFDETANVAGDPFDFDFFEFSSFLIERNHIGKLHAELTVP